MRFGTGQSFSIRRLNTNAGNQSISHDFFTALEPTDNHDLERITLSLELNALLIRVGNPQGTAVTTTKRITRRLPDKLLRFTSALKRRAVISYPKQRKHSGRRFIRQPTP